MRWERRREEQWEQRCQKKPGGVKTHKNTAILERHEKRRAEERKHKTEANLERHNKKRRGEVKTHKNEEILEPHGAGFAWCYSNHLQKLGKGCKGRDEGNLNPETGLGCRRMKNQV